jgi:hypothetical protein
MSAAGARTLRDRSWDVLEKALSPRLQSRESFVGLRATHPALLAALATDHLAGSVGAEAQMPEARGGAVHESNATPATCR